MLPANKGKKSGVSKMATLRGFTPFPYLDAIAAKKIAVTEVNTAEAALQMGAAGRVDGVYLGVLSAQYGMSLLKTPDMLVFDPNLPNSTNDFSLSSISHPEVVKQMDDFLTSDKALVKKLKDKYKIAD